MTASSFLRFFLPGSLALTAVLGLLPACDVIDNPVPPQTVSNAARSDTARLDSAEAQWLALPGHNVARQRVLLEDYTGHTCGNCPRAAEKAHELQRQFGDTLVVVATHVGYFADTTKPGYRYDFRTAAGNELNTVFSVDNFGLPQGMVNRAPVPGAAQPVVPIASWLPQVIAQASRPPQQQLVVTALRSGADGVIVKVSAKYLAASTGTYRLVLNYVEDSLTSQQKDYSLPAPSDIPKYLHQHILRYAPLGTFGEVNATAPAEGYTVNRYVRYPLPAQPWARRPAHLVAYLLDAYGPSAKDWRVVQVAQTKLK